MARIRRGKGGEKVRFFTETNGIDGIDCDDVSENVAQPLRIDEIEMAKRLIVVVKKSA